MHRATHGSAALQSLWSLPLAGFIGLTAGLLIPFNPLLAQTTPTNQKIAVRSAPASTRWLQVSLSRRRVTVFQGRQAVESYPIGIGRAGWETPIGSFKVGQMQKNPTWISPFTNQKIPGGDPRNPLRGYWIGFWSKGDTWVGFHGTLDRNTVGKAASHGCLHLYDRDLARLFSQVELGTPVQVVP